MSLCIPTIADPSSGFFAPLTDDLVTLIANKCDIKTWENFRAVNHRIKSLCEGYIFNSTLAQSIVFHHPRLYRQISMSSLSMHHSPEVAASALTQHPESILESDFLPEPLKEHAEIKKTAYVAAKLSEEKNPMKAFFQALFDRLSGQENRTEKLFETLLQDEEVQRFVRLLKQDPASPALATELMRLQPAVLESVRHDGRLLQFADPKFLKNEEILTTALSQNGLALECAGEENQDNIDYVLLAVSQNGLAYRFASERVQKIKKVLLRAARQNLEVFQLAHPDTSFLRKLIRLA